MQNPEPAKSLDSFLASLQSDDVHSSGAFTISADKAQDKLSRYSLVHPSLYVLQLVSAAVRGKATRFQAKDEGAACHFLFDGEPLTGQDLQSVMGQLFETFTSQRLRDLAIALTAAHSTTEEDLVVVASDGVYEFDGKAFTRTEKLGDPEFTHVRVPGKFRLFSRLLKREDSLKETLSLCSYSPLELELNGKRFSKYFYPNQSYLTGATLEWLNPNYPIKSGMTYLRARSVQECPHDFSAVLFLTANSAAQETGLRIVLAGVPYRTDQDHLHNPGVCAVVCTNSLQTDLSCSAIAQNEAFLKVVDLLNGKAEEFLRESFCGPDRYSSQLRKMEMAARAELGRLTSKTDPGFARWLKGLSRFQEDPSPDTLEQAAQNEDAEVAEDLRLLAAEAIIDRFKANPRERDLGKIMALTPQLDRLLSELPATSRTEVMSRFLDMAAPRPQKPRCDTPEIRFLVRRVQGDLPAALEAFSALDYTFQLNDANPQADMLLADERYDEAMEVLLKRVMSDSLEQALKQQFDFYRLEMDLIADCLEYQNHPQSIRFRQRAYESTDSEDLKYLRCIELARQARKSSDIALWIKYQAAAGFHWMGEARTFWGRLHRKVPNGRKILERKVPVPERVDDFLLPLKDAFSLYAKLYPYLLSRLCHHLRLAGQAGEAERILSRAFTIAEMDRYLQEL